MNFKVIEGKRFEEERALYGENNLLVRGCRFQGPKDGESVLKECHNLIIENTSFNLRYPIWHTKDCSLSHCFFLENSRAPLWYGKDIHFVDCKMNVIKAIRECEDVFVANSTIYSDEFAWKTSHIELKNTSLTGVYAFFDSKNITLDKVNFEGKYSFQYCENLTITNSVLNTKDAFWHSKNIVVKDSIIKGEYLGWFSENLTLIRCRITGTQPLCYCKNLRLMNCTMEGCDLAFEYSEVNAILLGSIQSIKNPASGRILVGRVGELIRDNAVHENKGEVFVDDNLFVK